MGHILFGPSGYQTAGGGRKNRSKDRLGRCTSAVDLGIGEAGRALAPHYTFQGGPREISWQLLRGVTVNFCVDTCVFSLVFSVRPCYFLIHVAFHLSSLGFHIYSFAFAWSLPSIQILWASPLPKVRGIHRLNGRNTFLV